MLFKGETDNEGYPIIDCITLGGVIKYFVNWVVFFPAGGAGEQPLWEDENGYAITGNYDGDSYFRFPTFDTVEEAKTSLPDQVWVAV